MKRLVNLCAVILALIVLVIAPANADDSPTPVELTSEGSGKQDGIVVGAIKGSSTNSSNSANSGKLDNTGNGENLDNGGSLELQRVVAEGFCDHLYRDVVTNHPCWRRYPASEEEPPVEEEGVDPIDLLHTAVALARIDGAGPVVEPGRDWVYQGVPTLAHAAHQSVETSVTLFDLDVPVRFDAVEYVFDFHSGQPPVRTSEPGQPYPDMTIQGVYQAEHPSQFVTLTTMWDASVIHPVTGDVLSVPGALRTVETSRTFRVVRAKQRLIAPSEFGKPH